MYNYVVTAHKPSAVHLSLTANFTGPKDKNLIVTKSNWLVIYLLTPEGLQPILETAVCAAVCGVCFGVGVVMGGSLMRWCAFVCV